MSKPSLKGDVIDGWRRTPLFAKALIAVLAAVTVYSLIQARRLAKMAHGRTGYLIAELQASKESHAQQTRYFQLMTEEFAQIRDAVRPLQTFAIEKFSERDPMKALDLLIKDLGLATARAETVPYQPLTRWLKQNTIDALGLAVGGMGQGAQAVVSLGLPGDNQFPLSSDVTRILREVGVAADPGPRDNRWADGMKRVRFTYGAGAEDLARRLSEGLKPLLKGERDVASDSALPAGSVRIILHGTPSFNSDGSATF